MALRTLPTGARARRRGVTLALGSILLLAVPACSGGAAAGGDRATTSDPAANAGPGGTVVPTGPFADDPTATSAPVPTPEPDSDEGRILVAVDGYWTSYVAATHPPDPNHPDLARFTAGAALERERHDLESFRQLNQEVRSPAGSRSSQQVTHTTIDGARATVRTCVVDDGVLVDAPSGIVLNDEVVTMAVDLLLEQRPHWVVVDAVKVAEWSGVRSCDG